MRLNEVVYSDAKPVEGYGPGFFRIGGTVFEGPVIAGTSGVSAWQGFDDHAPLLALAGKVWACLAVPSGWLPGRPVSASRSLIAP